MDALAQVESSDNYGAVGQNRGSKYGVAQGRYQIMSGIIPGWAAEAGYGGITTQQFLASPEVQDAIAAHKMSQYYDRYDGSWELVAAAWFGGIGAADKARAQGIGATASINDSGNQPGSGINVPTYIQRVINNMGKGGGTSRVQLPSGERVTPQQAAQQAITPDQSMDPQRKVAQSVMQHLSDMVKQNPNSPEMHNAMRQAMQSLLGPDAPAGGTQGVADQPIIAASDTQPRAATPAPEATPTEAPGIGQSGVR